jgi:hypothetical protein
MPQADACRVLRDPNAGGNSLRSEVLSMEYLVTRFGARLLHTELELQYRGPWKRFDVSTRVLYKREKTKR